MRLPPTVLFSTWIALLTMTAAGLAAEPDLRGIMQGLRDNVVEIADGLLTDDFAMVLRGANGIANHPRIPPDQVQRVAAELGPEMAAFKQFDMSVHDLSLSIATAAERKDSARAISDFQSMLSGCFGCHTAYKDRVSAVLAGGSE